MKLSATKLFEFAKIASTDAGKQIKEFVDFANANFEEIIRALTGQLSLADNIKGEQLVLQLIHNQETVTTIEAVNVIGVLPLKVVTDSVTREALSNLSWYATTGGKLALYPQFKVANVTKARTVTIYVLTN